MLLTISHYIAVDYAVLCSVIGQSETAHGHTGDVASVLVCQRPINCKHVFQHAGYTLFLQCRRGPIPDDERWDGRA